MLQILIAITVGILSGIITGCVHLSMPTTKKKVIFPYRFRTTNKNQESLLQHTDHKESDHIGRKSFNTSVSKGIYPN
ncbi:hypothetical protein ACFL0V_01775 [Nanoarchaeota archaeon]